MRRIDEISPFLGVDDNGNCLPGPCRPLGMVRPGPDTDVEQTRHTSGYQSGLPIVRFSQVHVSGTGGGGRYGNISISPYCGAPSFEYPRYEALDEEAAVGFYGVTLGDSGIRVALTCAARSSVYKINYPEGCAARLLIDAGAALRDGGQAVDGDIDCTGPQEISGWVELVGGWGHDHPYRIFFSMHLSRLIQKFRRDGLRIDMELDRPGELDISIGISFISRQKARQNRERETAGKTFEQVRGETEELWENVLSRVDIEGGIPEDRGLHYTMLYRLLTMPGDLGVDDEFPRWRSGVRQFNDFFCLWDSCRNANGFLDLAFPELSRDILNCLLDIGEQTGWLPDAWMSFHKGFMQGGCSADTLLGQAALKKLPGIDLSKALPLMRRNHEDDPPDPDTAGRYMKEFRELDYVSTAVEYGCVSRHLEYTLQDTCTAAVADQLGHKDIAEHYAASRDKTMLLWHPEKKCFYPKTSAGDWIEDFDITQPFIQDGHYSADPFFFEGTALEWSLTPLHVMNRIVEAHGGAEAFAKHLDRFFGGGMYKWKEIILHTPYLYLYAGRADRSADILRKQRALYNTSRSGLPENEDMGSHSTFVIASGIGLYPAMGQDIYWLSPPHFDATTLRDIEGRTIASIKTRRSAPDARYIGSIKLNGKPLNRSWVRHSELCGSTLEFDLQEKPAEGSFTEPPPC